MSENYSNVFCVTIGFKVKALQRAWLNLMGALLFHNLSNTDISTKLSAKLSTDLSNDKSIITGKLLKNKNITTRTIKNYLQNEFPDLCEPLKSYSVEAIVREVGLLNQSAILHDYWPNEHSLSDAQLIRLLTDQSKVIKNEHQREPVKLSLPTNLSTPTTNAKTKSDFKVKRQVNTIFCHYFATNPKNDRRKASYKQSLIKLKKCQQQMMSMPLWFAVSWATQLFENGTSWKEKLAPSTL